MEIPEKLINNILRFLDIAIINFTITASLQQIRQFDHWHCSDT